ncbi:MAG: tyrosine--tRNA ligase [Bacteroidetes bacterium]|nr:MAG: tyrosine--tRNA ligase [Bacteroidota bacterium]
MASNVFDEFEWRELLYDATPDLRKILSEESLTAYIGFDPTASSLHVGSLVPVMGLARLQRFGHTPIAIIGGGTGLIGDPSGRTAERLLLDSAQVQENLEGIRGQLERFLDFESKSNAAQIVNNLEWLGSIRMIDFLRDVGKYFTVNYMLAKESVKRRMEAEDGISYTEFTYMMLQAYDFLELYDRYDCTLQLGGSDQWGNIVAGADLIRRLRGKRAHGFVFPLVTNAAGTKFGKTEAGNIWLDPERTSPYRFYQYWLNADDRDVIKYLKYFTWFSKEEIDEFASSLAENPEKRVAQHALADAVTELVHGESEVSRAQQASRVMFGEAMDSLSVDDILDVFEDVPSSDLDRGKFDGEGLGILDLLADSGLTASKGEARRLVRSGGAYLNNIRQTDEHARVALDDLIEGKLIVLRKGQKNYRVVQVS